MNDWLNENGDIVLPLVYLVGVPLSFGMMVSKLEVLAILLSLVWLATGLAYLGYWLTS